MAPDVLAPMASHHHPTLWRKAHAARWFAILLAIALPPSAGSQVTPSGMGTRVNGSAFGSCLAGSCAIHGGIKAGKNLYHRFGRFDTRNGITDVKLDTRLQENVIIGVSGSEGFWLNKPFHLSSTANLFLLSPSGVWLGSGASFANAPNILLSTSASLNIGPLQYHVFRSSTQGAMQLNAEPAIHWDDLNNPASKTAGLGSAGDGSIVFAGGLITVDRNLFIDAIGGAVNAIAGSQSTIKAGENVHIVAREVDLNRISISAGQARSQGTIAINAGFGNVRMDTASLTAPQLLISGGSIDLKRSQLLAADGLIEIQARNKFAQGSSLQISQSDLDISPKAAFAPRDGTGSLAIPSISLSSDGDVRIARSRLNASSERAPMNNPQRDETDAPLLSRSGLIRITAKKAITLEESSLTADAAKRYAGQIALSVDGDEQGEGIRIHQSRLSASHGMGYGVLSLNSASGITIDGSALVANSDRYPLIHGNPFGLSDGNNSQQQLPFSFHGGQISLNNSSGKRGILINNSKLLALQSKSGGALDIPDFLAADQDYGFTLGYQEFWTGGTILLISQGGLEIGNKSLVDASSRTDNTHTLENLAGTIEVVNVGTQPMIIRDATIHAKAGPALDPKDTNSASGGIFITSNSQTLVQNSSFDTSADATKSLANNRIPFISISTCESCLVFSGKNRLNAELAYVENGQRLTDGSINLAGLHGKPGPDILDDTPKATTRRLPVPPVEIYSNLDSYISLFQKQAESSLRTGSSLTGLARESSFFGAANPFVFKQPDSLTTSGNATQDAVALTIDLANQEASSAFVEAEQRASETTLKRLGLSNERARLRSIAELQGQLAQASALSPLPRRAATPGPAQTLPRQAPPTPYRPAILHLQRDDQTTGQSKLTAILLTAKGEPISSTTELPRAQLEGWIRGFQRQLSRRAPSPVTPTKDPSWLLSRALLAPIAPELRQQGVTALLLAVDRGLQAIPYAALPLEGRPLGEAFALTITPSLGLIDLDPSQLARRGADGPLLLAGASDFPNGLEPLPMVRQELRTLAAEHPSLILLDGAFTPAALMEKALAANVRQIHIATHANFLPGQGGHGLLYTPTAPLSLAELGRGLRSRANTRPLDLISLSGCLTALGDEDSELGFIGMALQAGARSGLGTLWEVDDAASAAFFIQFYRHLKEGLSKDQALQATQRDFLQGLVRLQEDRLVGPDPSAGNTPTTLVGGLPQEQRTLFAQGLDHPYYWAGMVLSGNPW